MGDSTKTAKARRELEELYSGVPDDSVNLTFGDLAEVRQPSGGGGGGGSGRSQPHPPTADRKNSYQLDPITEASPRREEVAPLAKMPSLDFSRGLEASALYNSSYHQSKQGFHHPMHNYNDNSVSYQMNHLHGNDKGFDHDDHQKGSHYHNHRHKKQVMNSPYNSSHHGMQHSPVVYDHDISQMSGFPERGGRRRPGIPHSNICTVCSTYIYLFRHRCLVCGRVYCRQCVSTGMGEMPEGRKCVECLGRRFSQRYIKRAGQTGCCMGYPSLVKQQELKWAEKGPRGSGENNHPGRSEMMSRPVSPMPMGPLRGAHNHNTNHPPSFVSNTQGSFVMGSPSPYSPYYSPRNHPLPF